MPLDGESQGGDGPQWMGRAMEGRGAMGGGGAETSVNGERQERDANGWGRAMDEGPMDEKGTSMDGESNRVRRDPSGWGEP